MENIETLEHAKGVLGATFNTLLILALCTGFSLHHRLPLSQGDNASSAQSHIDDLPSGHIDDLLSGHRSLLNIGSCEYTFFNFVYFKDFAQVGFWLLLTTLLVFGAYILLDTIKNDTCIKVPVL